MKPCTKNGKFEVVRRGLLFYIDLIIFEESFKLKKN